MSDAWEWGLSLSEVLRIFDQVGVGPSKAIEHQATACARCSYLKISLSDFLTLFSARTSSFFWQRGLGRALGIAACVAMGTSTIFSLVWCVWRCPGNRPCCAVVSSLPPRVPSFTPFTNQGRLHLGAL